MIGGAEKLLLELGLPAGAARPPRSAMLPSVEELREAIAVVSGPHCEPCLHEALAAWLAAFEHHWPLRFAELLGAQGAETLARLSASADANRVLKLRRIAIANLAQVL